MKRIPTEVNEIIIDSEIKLDIPDYVFELNDNEIFTIKNVPTNYIEVFVFKINKKIEKNINPFCWRLSSIEEINKFKAVEIVDNLIFIYSFDEKVFNWSKVRYSIGNCSKPENMQLKIIKIVKYPIGIPDDENIVFKSINELKIRSSLYRSLNPAEKNKVCKPKNIETAEHSFLSLKFNNDDNTAKFLHHLYLGTISNGTYSGIHHIYPILVRVAKLEEIIDLPNANGIWRGIVALKDKRHQVSSECKEWKYKDNKLDSDNKVSTFFPNHWDNIKLIRECKYAFDNRRFRDQGKQIKYWDSDTISGISVEIITDNNEILLSMYPCWEKERTKLSV